MQKISFIRSLLAEVRLLLLDESTSNLDVATIPLSGWIDTEVFMANKPLSRFRYNQEEVTDIMLLKDKYDLVFCATGLLPDYLSEIYRNDMFRSSMSTRPVY